MAVGECKVPEQLWPGWLMPQKVVDTKEMKIQKKQKKNNTTRESRLNSS